MKHILSIFLTLALLLSLNTTVLAEGSARNRYVDDQAGILTQAEIEDLTKKAETASQAVDCGIYIITVEDFNDLGYEQYWSITPVLSSYYEDEGYGFGSDRDGIILMLSMDARDFGLFTEGFGDSGLSDDAKDYLLTKFLDDFRNDQWYNGFEDYIYHSMDLLQKTLDGHPYDPNAPTPAEITFGCIICLGIALLIAHLITRHYEKQMLSVELETDAEDLRET